MAPTCTTQIVNNTNHAFDMKVGNSLYLVDLTKLGRGAKYSMPVDYTDTYQEYMFHVSGSSVAALIVTSDDCCDYKFITITESAEGKFDMHREPRVRSCPDVVEADPVPTRQRSEIASWKFWIGINIF